MSLPTAKTVDILLSVYHGCDTGSSAFLIISLSTTGLGIISNFDVGIFEIIEADFATPSVGAT